MAGDELEIIAKHFAPLATHPAARKLEDDLAVLQTRGPLAITADTIIEGVHFLPDDPIETIAKKALRVNISDLAAKGARAIGILLSLSWPKARRSAEIARFAAGLGEDLKLYRCALLGGDTTATPGPLSVSVTAIGRPYRRRIPARADGKPGEDLWITGSIGDAHLGLRAARGELGSLPARDRDLLIDRFRLPQPRTRFAQAIARLAGAAMDVSDGLLLDAARLAHASRMALTLEAASLPHSTIAQRWLETPDAYQLRLLSGGDDYEILFTAAPEKRASVKRAATRAGLQVTRIGGASAGEGVSLVDSHGAPLPIPDMGYRHTLGG
ncbi:MAG: thiamine-phosphate kinase [Alphaproteobacteria bacterium]|nr:thiamine-phosphate kinase [Alphaproteobacteria bacterium]